MITRRGFAPWAASIAALALFLPASRSPAQEPSPWDRWMRQEQAAGNWGGVRTHLEEKGLKFEAVFTGEVFANVAGGIDRKAVFLDNFDMTLSADLEKLLGWSNTTLFLYGLGDQGGNPSNDTGDAQGISSIAAYSTWKLYEAWLQRNFPGARLSLLAGFYDLNSEFDTLETANYFLNPSHGIGPEFAESGRNGPSIFPTTTVGARARWVPSPNFYLQSVLLNGLAGNPNDPAGTHLIVGRGNGVLSTTEAAYLGGPVPTTAPARGRRRRLGRLLARPYNAKLAVGAWFYSATFDALYERDPAGNPLRLGGNHGIYAVTEMRIWGPSSSPEQGLTAFARAGWANPRMNRFRLYTGGGGAYRGLGRRSQDVVGIAVAGAHNGQDYRRAQARAGHPVERTEWNLELTYHAQILPWLALHPDIQYVIHPDTVPERKNALALGLRFEVAF